MCPTEVKDTREEQHINVIFHEEVCATLTRGRPRVATDPITCENKLPKTQEVLTSLRKSRIHKPRLVCLNYFKFQNLIKK